MIKLGFFTDYGVINSSMSLPLMEDFYYYVDISGEMTPHSKAFRDYKHNPVTQSRVAGLCLYMVFSPDTLLCNVRDSLSNLRSYFVLPKFGAH